MSDSGKKHSKAYITFTNRLLHFNDDLELMDIMCRYVSATNTANGSLFSKMNPAKYPYIARYGVSQDNRIKIATHAKATMSAAYVKDLYEEFASYLRSALAEAFSNMKASPERIVGDLSKLNMSLKDILTYAQSGDIVGEVINLIFQGLESERSTIKLIGKVCGRLGLEVRQNIIEEAVYYLEIRHKLVHADGFADDKFRAEHKKLKYTADSYIDLTYSTLTAMRQKVSALVEAIDDEAITKQILRPHTEP